MRKRYMAALLAGIVFFIAANIASAGVVDRIRDQERRIDRGTATGSITRQEAATLRDNLSWIKARYARLKADGMLTPSERRSLEAMLDQNDQMIYNKNHNPIRQVYSYDYIIDQIGDQQRRIDQGIRSGSLTRSEAAILQDNLQWIKNRFMRIKADGLLTKKEVQNLERMLHRNSQMIINKKHNAIRRVY